MNKLMTKNFQKAKAEGRLCERCGWMITKRGWKLGHKICEGCADALKGVNVSYGNYADAQEPVDKTGNML